MLAQPQPPQGWLCFFWGLGQVQCGVAAPSCTPWGEDPEGATPVPRSSSIREEGLELFLQHPLVWGHVQEVQLFREVAQGEQFQPHRALAWSRSW